MIWAIPFCLAFAFIGYAHGLQWFDKNLPTDLNRILCVLFISMLTALPLKPIDISLEVFWWCVVTTALWIIPGEMSQITDAIGDNPKCSRLYGTLKLTVRELLIIPLIAGVCYLTQHAYWPVIGSLLLGLPYCVGGLVLTGKLRRFVVVIPHAVKFATIGAMLWMGTR